MEHMYAIFCILGGALLMAFAIWVIKLFKEAFKTAIYDQTRELRRAVYTLSSDVNQIRGHSDVMDDKINNLITHVDKLEMDIAAMQEKIEKADYDILSDKTDSILKDIDQLVKNIAGMQIEMEGLKYKIKNLEAMENISAVHVK